MPCPCSTATGGDHHGGGSHGDDGAKHKQSCRRPKHVQRLVFSRRKYPHMRIALRHGWPRRLVLNRRGADARRDRLLEHIATREGYDRDEYPPAVGRGRGKGL